MSSESDFDHSSSSDQRKKDDDLDSQKRSRSRSKQHRSHNDRSKRPTKKTIIKIPQLSGHLIKFKTFMNNQPQRIDSQKASKAYNKYKKDWQDKQNETFLIQHKNDAWFIEKYYPEYRQEIEQERITLVRSLADLFFSNFKKGAYKDINLSIADTSHLGYSGSFQNEEDDEMGQNSVQIVLSSNVEITKKPYYGFDPDYLTLFMKSIPRQIFKKDIQQQARKIPGFKNLFISQPLKKQGFTRYCWLTFSDEDSFNKAEIALSGLHIKGQTLQITKSNSKQRRVRVLKVYPRNRITTDCKVTKDLIRLLDKQNGIQQNIILENFESTEKQLDINLLYLRRVHGYDYFTAQQFLDERQLSTKIGLSHLRVTVDFDQDYDIPNNLKKIQQQAQKRIQNKKITTDSITFFKEQIQQMIGGNDSSKDKQVWKCTQCDKKFVSSDFLTKHMIGKHPQIKKKLSEKISEKLYCTDKNRITNYPPSPSDYDQKRNYSRNYRGNKKPYGRRDNRHNRQSYQDLDDPKTTKQTTGNRTMVNFLDI